MRRRSQKEKQRASTTAFDAGSVQQETPAEASTPRPPDFTLPWSLIVMDFGTTTYSSAYYYLAPGEPFDKSKIERITFAATRNNEYTGPTIAAYHNDRWIIGRELALQVENVPAHKIIRNFKILLYDPDAPQSRKVKKQLEQAGQSEEQLLTAFMQYIWNDIREYINTELFRGSKPPELTETLLYISVPMLVTPKTTERLRAAVNEAGLPRVAFVSEPICAAAGVLEEVARKRKWSLQTGSTALVLDCGGGTTDAVLVKLLGTADYRLHEVMQVAGEPEGIQCGSSSVDESFERWMQEKWLTRSEFQTVVDKLDITREQLLRLATSKFQMDKKRFDNRPETRYDGIYIRGARDESGKEIPLDRARIESFFAPHVNAIIALAQKLIKKDTKYIFLTGGLASNIYVKKRIEQAFPDMHVIPPLQDHKECTVARGGLLMEHHIDQSGIPSLFSLGLVLESEPYDPKIHMLPRYKNGKIDKRMIKSDIWYSTNGRPQDVVEDRIIWLLDQDAQADRNGLFRSEKISVQQFHIPMKKSRLTYKVVFTRKSKAELKDHEALYDPNGNIRPEFEIEHRAYDLPCDLVQKLYENDWVQWLPRKDEPSPILHLELLCKFGLRHDNRSIDVGLQICDPTKLTYATGEKLTADADPGTIDDGEWIKVWDTDTHVLKSCLSAEMHQSGDGSTVAGPSRDASHAHTTISVDGSDDEMPQLLQSAAQKSHHSSHLSHSVSSHPNTAFDPVNGNVTAGRKRSANDAANLQVKRHNAEPKQLDDALVDSRMVMGTIVGQYHTPEWYGL